VLIELLTLNYIFAYFLKCYLVVLSVDHACIVLKLFLGKYISLQFFLKFQFFSVKRPGSSLLRSDGCGSDGWTVK
jgi:hypothetical protein